jgi:exo-beta-1,3-glucanase (GH17 family)
MGIGSRIRIALALLLAAGTAAASDPPPAGDATGHPVREAPFAVRPFEAAIGKRWIGEAIAYGPHRDGQFPGGPAPTRAEVREDLHLMVRHWNLIRVYGAVGTPDTMLSLIRAERLPIKVLLGVWIQPEDRRDPTGAVVDRLPEGQAANSREVEAAVRLAAAYPEIVAGISVGNETQVSWSGNRVPTAVLVDRIREVRARVRVPVTTADDVLYWKLPESRALADELDFVTTHLHPLWAGQSLDSALAWTKARFAEVRATHAGRGIVIGETGWATGRLTTGEQGRLIHGRTGEAEQKVFCDAAAAWARREHVVTFFFEAFDENWKGGQDRDDVEKHWGFFRADRTPKQVVAVAK